VRERKTVEREEGENNEKNKKQKTKNEHKTKTKTRMEWNGVKKNYGRKSRFFQLFY
jgi:hypothetical protein